MYTYILRKCKTLYEIRYKYELKTPDVNDTMYVHVYIYMGWLWLVGSIKLWVSFAKEPYKRDYVLRKRPVIFHLRDIYRANDAKCKYIHIV